MESPLEALERLSDELLEIIERFKDEDRGEAVFTKEDVDRILNRRLGREKQRVRKAEGRVGALEGELERLRGLAQK